MSIGHLVKNKKKVFYGTDVAFVCSVLFILVRVLCPHPLGHIVFVAEFVDVVSCLHCISRSGIIDFDQTCTNTLLGEEGSHLILVTLALYSYIERLNNS